MTKSAMFIGDTVNKTDNVMKEAIIFCITLLDILEIKTIAPLSYNLMPGRLHKQQLCA